MEKEKFGKKKDPRVCSCIKPSRRMKKIHQHQQMKKNRDKLTMCTINKKKNPLIKMERESIFQLFEKEKEKIEE